VDDGSTEDITPLMLLAESESRRLQLLRQPNAGPAAARNLALGIVQGDYIAFLDADDRFLPQKIGRQLAQM
jgi:glycosyltransferase involved in cell wall biosynthesis